MTDVSPQSVKSARSTLATAQANLNTANGDLATAQTQLTAAQNALAAKPGDPDLTKKLEGIQKKVNVHVPNKIATANTAVNKAQQDLTTAINTANGATMYPRVMCTNLYSAVANFNNWTWYKNKKTGTGNIPIMYFRAPFTYAGRNLLAIAHIHGKGLTFNGAGAATAGTWVYDNSIPDKIEVFDDVAPPPGSKAFVAGNQWEYDPLKPTQKLNPKGVNIDPRSICDKVLFNNRIQPKIPVAQFTPHTGFAQWPAAPAYVYPARVGYGADSALYDGNYMGMLPRYVMYVWLRHKKRFFISDTSDQYKDASVYNAYLGNGIENGSGFNALDGNIALMGIALVMMLCFLCALVNCVLGGIAGFAMGIFVNRKSQRRGDKEMMEEYVMSPVNG